MGGQYFEKRPASKRRPAQFSVTLRGRSFTFRTDSGVFSREGLDRGTELLLNAIEVGPCETILDLGCGYGVIGIVAARLSAGGPRILTDVEEGAATPGPGEPPPEHNPKTGGGHRGGLPPRQGHALRYHH